MVLYLDAVYFNVLEWAAVGQEWGGGRMLTTITPQLLLCSFLHSQYSSLPVQFRRSQYHTQT